MMYPVEYNIYGVGSSPVESFKKDDWGKWQKVFYVKDYLGSTRLEHRLDLDYQNLAYPGGTRYAWQDSEPLRTSVSYQSEYAPYNDRPAGYVSRLSWLGKERDLESGYGDHGVRKYNSTAGRFMSVDPLWEKYLSWTPYQYSGNNPVNNIDINGFNWFSNESGEIKWLDHEGDYSEVESGITWKDIGANVIVGEHNRSSDYSEKVGSASFTLYLESNKEGPTAVEAGNTVPTNIKKRGVLSEGLYHGVVRSQKIGGNDRGDLVVLLEGGRKLPSLKPNPAHNNKPVMDEIFIHWGSKSAYPSSNGCQTISPGNIIRYNVFMSYLQTVKPNPIGLQINYYLIAK